MKTESAFCPVIYSKSNPAGHTGSPETMPVGNRIPDQPSGYNPFWVVELEDDGTVIYSRPHIIKVGDDDMTSLEGHNFFDKAMGFEDMTKCRQHFQSFVKSKKAVASFIWRCSSAAGTVDTKVLMTRAFQTGYCTPTGVVMMEIREC